MKNKIAGLTLGLAALICSPAVLGAAGDVTIAVEAMPTAVSYNDSSTPTKVTSYVIFKGTFTTNTQNTINNIAFNFQPSWATTLAIASVPGCTVVAGSSPTSYTCPLGKSTKGADKEVFVAFPAPTEASGITAVSLSGSFTYAESTSGGNPAPNSNLPFEGITVTFGPASANSVTSAVPPIAGQEFKTGPNPFDALLSDQVKTTVAFPNKPAVFTTLLVTESALPVDDVTCAAQGNFNRCYQVDITIPQLAFEGNNTGLFTFLIEAPANRNFKERNLLLTHDGTPVLPCSTSGPPCIESTKLYKAKPNTVPVLPDGTVEIIIRVASNGVWAIR
jgi:hypothetical protein